MLYINYFVAYRLFYIIKIFLSGISQKSIKFAFTLKMKNLFDNNIIIYMRVFFYIYNIINYIVLI